MTEIKFRAWNRSQKKMVYNGCHVLGVAGFDYMICTDLKDRSGIEIYQGDILKYKDGTVCEVDWHTWTPKITLYPENDMSEDDLREVWDEEGGSEDFEIIGNIYEWQKEREKLITKKFPRIWKN